jgi:hypothetical protein
VATFYFNVLHPGRDTLGAQTLLKSIWNDDRVRGIAFACFTLFVFWTLCVKFVGAFSEAFCGKEQRQQAPIHFEPIPFRRYRGRSFMRKRKRAPIYHLIHKRGRGAAIRFRDGILDPPKMSNRPRKRKPKQQKWAQTSREEDESIQKAEFERIKPGFLHNSFVMFKMQYGESLHDFVTRLDPIKEFRMACALSRSDLISPLRSKPLNRRKIERELDKYRANVCVLRGPDISTPSATVYVARNDELPIVINSGASFCLTPCIKDFISPLEASDATLTGLNLVMKVAGTGTVEWVVQDVTGMVKTIRCRAFYVPNANIRLFSPQQYFMEAEGGHLSLNRNKTVLTLHDGVELEFPYNAANRLPMMLTQDYMT